MLEGKWQTYAMPDPPPLIKARVTQTDPFTVNRVGFTGALYKRKLPLFIHMCSITSTLSRKLYSH